MVLLKAAASKSAPCGAKRAMTASRALIAERAVEGSDDDDDDDDSYNFV